MIYHQPAQLSPFAVGKCQKDGKLYISLSAPVVLCGEGDLLLEIAGEDGVFVPADAQLCGDTLILSSPSVSRPVMARYAWTDYAIVRLYGENGLPLAPFCWTE